MEASEMKRIAVDAMVKYVNNDEIYELAKTLEEAAETIESMEESAKERSAYVHA